MGKGGLDYRLLLAVAVEEEEDFGLEGVLLAVGVEAAEEGVLLEPLKEGLYAELLAQQTGERGFSDADYAFDDDVGHASLYPHRR